MEIVLILPKVNVKESLLIASEEGIKICFTVYEDLTQKLNTHSCPLLR